MCKIPWKQDAVIKRMTACPGEQLFLAYFSLKRLSQGADTALPPQNSMEQNGPSLRVTLTSCAAAVELLTLPDPAFQLPACIPAGENGMPSLQAPVLRQQGEAGMFRCISWPFSLFFSFNSSRKEATNWQLREAQKEEGEDQGGFIFPTGTGWL